MYWRSKHNPNLPNEHHNHDIMIKNLIIIIMMVKMLRHLRVLAQSASRLTAAAESYGAMQLEQKVIIIIVIVIVIVIIKLFIIIFIKISIIIIIITISITSIITIITISAAKHLPPQVSPAIEVDVSSITVKSLSLAIKVKGGGGL